MESADLLAHPYTSLGACVRCVKCAVGIVLHDTKVCVGPHCYPVAN